MRNRVIVIGAGSAGLAFARSLAGSGAFVTLVEAQPAEAIAAPRPDGREIALTHRSMHILRDLGVWDLIPPREIAPLREARVFNGSSPFALSFDPNGQKADRLGYLVPNHEIRRALYRSVEGQRNLEWIAGMRVAAIRTDADGAEIVLDDGRTLFADLLVAADSRLSFARDQLGIGAQVNRLGRSMLLCRLEHERDHGGIATEWFDHHQTIAMLPLRGRLSSAVLTLPDPQARWIAALDPEALGQEITRRFQARLGPMRVVAGPHLYPLVTIYAHHFAAVRAALIGDAAVGMHPVTAHGFNLGLMGQDRLATLVRSALRAGRDIGSPLLLRRYEAAHRASTRPLYVGTNLLVRLFTDERPLARVARHAGLRAASRFPGARRAVRSLLMQRA